MNEMINNEKNELLELGLDSENTRSQSNSTPAEINK
jgi:hypothetical protein